MTNTGNKHTWLERINPRTLCDGLARLPSYLFSDKVRLGSKLAVLVAIVYVLSPLDLLPELLVPMTGWLDDAAVAAWALNTVSSTMANLRRPQTDVSPGETIDVQAEPVHPDT